ncbi:MAG: ThuA domain-containing protein [Planctomycetota bacterium]
MTLKLALLPCLLAAATALLAAEADAPLRLLILSGKNNHNWQQTTPVLQKMFTGSGRFTVEVTNNPAELKEESFAKYDVIVSNWTLFPDVKKRIWDEKTEKAFLDFVRGGKGFVLIHAASTVFYTWPEFQELAGSWWKMDQTGHGQYHKFTVTIADKEHPVTRGLKDFAITDELWHRAGTAGELKTLCSAFSDKAKGGSGQNEPVVHWRECGKGRCFHIILGHDAAAMQNVGFQTLTLRGAEWAATGKVTLPIPENWPAAVDATQDAKGFAFR